MSDRRCTATTKQGKPCKSPPQRGKNVCLSHDVETREAVRFSGAQPGAGRPRRPREVELYQEVADEMREEMRAVLKEGLLAEQAVVVGGNSANAHIEMIPDNGHRLTTMREIMDRLHGKAAQTTTLDASGPLVNINLVTDANLRAELADLRRRTSAHRAIQPGWVDVGGGAEVDSAATH